MFKLITEHSIDSAHFLKGYKGKCQNIHGHRWRIVAEIYSKELIESGNYKGMIVDFAIFKNDLKELTNEYDHLLIIEENSISKELYSLLIKENFIIKSLPFRPTAENLAKHFFGELVKKGHPMKGITIYETPNNCASYEVDNV